MKHHNIYSTAHTFEQHKGVLSFMLNNYIYNHQMKHLIIPVPHIKCTCDAFDV